MDSPRYSLNKQDGLKILKGLGIALAGTTLAYLADLLRVIDFGDMNAIAVIGMPILMAAINAGLKWTKDNSPQE